MVKELTIRVMKLRKTIAELEETLRVLKKEINSAEAELELAVRTTSALVEIEGQSYAVISRSYDVAIIPLRKE
jgi:predicted  nucleic acid-binding Zn-ribbon protein